MYWKIIAIKKLSNIFFLVLGASKIVFDFLPNKQFELTICFMLDYFNVSVAKLTV